KPVSGVGWSFTGTPSSQRLALPFSELVDYTAARLPMPESPRFRCHLRARCGHTNPKRQRERPRWRFGLVCRSAVCAPNLEVDWQKGYFTTDEAMLGLSGLTSTVLVLGMTTRSMSSIGMAPRRT